MDQVADTVNVRILVLGDGGVGKSSLVQRICYGTVRARTQWTVGCDVTPMLYTSIASSRSCTVDFWDVGGSACYAAGRGCFLRALLLRAEGEGGARVLTQHADGIMLVCDRTNTKSYHNLLRWRDEVTAVCPDAAPGSSAKRALPWLVVCNKSEGPHGRLPDARRDYGVDIVASSATDLSVAVPARIGTFIDAALDFRIATLRGDAAVARRGALRPAVPRQRRRAAP